MRSGNPRGAAPGSLGSPSFGQTPRGPGLSVPGGLAPQCLPACLSGLCADTSLLSSNYSSRRQTPSSPGRFPSERLLQGVAAGRETGGVGSSCPHARKRARRRRIASCGWRGLGGDGCAGPGILCPALGRRPRLPRRSARASEDLADTDPRCQAFLHTLSHRNSQTTHLTGNKFRDVV